MAKYTVDVRRICETYAGRDTPARWDEIDDVLAACWNKIFTTQAPIFDEDYRGPLCRKILKHYYMREIGAETPGEWLLWMNRTLEEQLPYYNQLYNSALLEFPVFENVDYASKHTRENTGETTSDTKTDGTEESETATKSDGTSSAKTEESGKYHKEGTEGTTSNTTGSTTGTTDVTGTGTTTGRTTDDSEETDWNLYSDTPEGGLENITNSNQHLTDIRRQTAEKSDVGTSTQSQTTQSTTTGSGSEKSDTTGAREWDEDGTDSRTTETSGSTSDTGSTTGSVTRAEVYNALGSSHDLEDFAEHVGGKMGTETYAEMLLKFRDTFLNIDMDMIKQFEENFLQLW